MVLRSLGIAAGACALVAGSALAGHAAGTSGAAPPQAPAATPAQVQAADADTVELAALADDTATAADGQRRAKLCARVPNALLRTQNLQKRLAGDASVRGSLAWLEAQATSAEAGGRTGLATVLRNRLAFRTELAEFLPQRLELLQKARSTVCAPGAAATS